MRFLRRNAAPAEVSSDQPADTAPDAASTAEAGGSAGKGRPTPKRRDAENRRRGPVAPPPRTQREAFRRMRGNKDERRAERAERRERMLSGDDKYLLPRDRGPVRAYVRDLVDSRWHLMGLFMPLAGVVLLTIFVQDPAIQSAISLLTMAMLAVMVVETLFLGRYINQKVRAKFPNENIRPAGLTFYAFTRATMLRRLRTPRPRLARGQSPD
ncbi:MAG TPA: DUF3043 domain-containing protein [Pseudonocardiaceae bacterium]